MTAPAPTSAPRATLPPGILDTVRGTVRGLLEETPAFAAAPPELRRSLARGMVDVSAMAAHLLAAERRPGDRRRSPLARAASAGDQLGLQANKAAAGQLKGLKDAIDFPTFVTSLITGVFQSISTSSLQQLQSVADLLDNISATADEFTDANVSDDAARSYAAQKFPFVTVSDGQLQLRDGVDLSTQTAALKLGLGASADDIAGIDGSDLEGSLLPLVRQKMGKDRQGLLATMVQMGLQRIVVDEGRLHASMDLRVDARSNSEEQKGQRDDWRVNAGASGSFSLGMWGASVNVSTSVGQVKSDQQYTQEELASRAEIRSSVDLAFRTDQVPLDKMASPAQRARIDSNARVPADVASKDMLEANAGPHVKPADFGALPSVPAAPAAPTPKDAKQDQKKQDQAKADQAKADQAKADQAKADQAKADQAKADQAKTDQSKTDQTKTDQTKTDQTKTDQTKSDQTKPPPKKTNKQPQK